MSESRWYIAVSYDIVDNKIRRKVDKLMKGYGERVQKSVFDCLLDEQMVLELQERMRKIIDPNRDSVRYYQLCTRCERSIHVEGCGEVQEDENIVVI